MIYIKNKEIIKPVPFDEQLSRLNAGLTVMQQSMTAYTRRFAAAKVMSILASSGLSYKRDSVVKVFRGCFPRKKPENVSIGDLAMYYIKNRHGQNDTMADSARSCLMAICFSLVHLLSLQPKEIAKQSRRNPDIAVVYDLLFANVYQYLDNLKASSNDEATIRTADKILDRCENATLWKAIGADEYLKAWLKYELQSYTNYMYIKACDDGIVLPQDNILEDLTDLLILPVANASEEMALENRRTYVKPTAQADNYQQKGNKYE